MTLSALYANHLPLTATDAADAREKNASSRPPTLRRIAALGGRLLLLTVLPRSRKCPFSHGHRRISFIITKNDKGNGNLPPDDRKNSAECSMFYKICKCP